MKIKEIIVSGVDVSECVNLYLSPQNNCVQCTNYVDRYCVMHPNCIFKRNKCTEQKLAKALACIDKCVSDFCHEIGTPYYGELLKSARELGLIAEAKDE